MAHAGGGAPAASPLPARTPVAAPRAPAVSPLAERPRRCQVLSISGGRASERPRRCPLLSISGGRATTPRPRGLWWPRCPRESGRAGARCPRRERRCPLVPAPLDLRWPSARAAPARILVAVLPARERPRRCPLPAPRTSVPGSLNLRWPSERPRRCPLRWRSRVPTTVSPGAHALGPSIHSWPDAASQVGSGINSSDCVQNKNDVVFICFFCRVDFHILAQV